MRKAVKLPPRPLHQQHGLVPLRVPERLRAGRRTEMPRSAFRQCPHYYSNPVTPAPAPAFTASQPNLLMCVTFCKLMILLDASVADRYCIDFCAAHWRREAVPLSRRLSASQMWMNALQTETSASRTAPARTDRARTRASAATATSCQRTNAAARVSLRSSGTTGTLFSDRLVHAALPLQRSTCLWRKRRNAT